jgi:hypothetical protein
MMFLMGYSTDSVLENEKGLMSKSNTARIFGEMFHVKHKQRDNRLKVICLQKIII